MTTPTTNPDAIPALETKLAELRREAAAHVAAVFHRLDTIGAADPDILQARAAIRRLADLAA